MTNYQKYLRRCSECGSTTSKKYARLHDGLCKSCVEPSSRIHNTPTREERILESGYLNYAREEGYFDQGDN